MEQFEHEPTLGEPLHSEEIRLSDFYLHQIELRPELVGASSEAGPIKETDARYARLLRVFRRVVAASHAHEEVDGSAEFVLLDDPKWNAFTLGGYKYVFFSGLTDTLDDDELAVAVGHEVAHSTASHTSERISFNLFVDITDDRNGESGWVELNILKQEREADELGILYSTLAGFDPLAAPRLWKKAKDKTSVSSSIHPNSEERITQSHRMAKRVLKYYVPGQRNPDFEAILDCNILYCPAKFHN